MRMEWSSDLALMGNEMLAFNSTLFEAGHPEAAFHMLEAALHCADDCGDAATLHRVEAVGAQQHRQLAQQIQPGRLWKLGYVEATTRAASLERLYAAVELQARAKAAALERHTYHEP